MFMGKQDQLDSIHAIVAGNDAWPQFWADYGKLILYEFKKYDIHQGAVRDDIFQELVLKLIKHDKRALRRFLSNSESNGFYCYLRVVLRSVISTYFRKHNKYRDYELLADGALIPNTIESDWSMDPSNTSSEFVDCERILLAVCKNNRESETFKILSLRYIDQESVTYIARKLNLKPNTVSQRIKYYLKQIKEQFGEDLVKVLNE